MKVPRSKGTETASVAPQSHSARTGHILNTLLTPKMRWTQKSLVFKLITLARYPTILHHTCPALSPTLTEDQLSEDCPSILETQLHKVCLSVRLYHSSLKPVVPTIDFSARNLVDGSFHHSSWRNDVRPTADLRLKWSSNDLLGMDYTMKLVVLLRGTS